MTFSHSNYRNQPSADIRIAVKSDQLAEALNQICGHTVAPQSGELYVAHFSDARHWDPDITINTVKSGNLIPIPSSIEQFYSVFSEIWEFADQHALPLAKDIIEMDPRALKHVAHCPCNRLMAAIAVAVVEKHGLLASDPLVHDVLKRMIMHSRVIGTRTWIQHLTGSLIFRMISTGFVSSALMVLRPLYGSASVVG